MKFISTNGKSESVSFLEAMATGLAPDGGLYIPKTVPVLSSGFWQSLNKLNFREIAFNMAKPFLQDEMTDKKLQSVIDDAFNFPVVLKQIDENIFVLELFHGPTLAFKDFGARFMARMFSEIAQKNQKNITILVATSGDTGSAVARGFYKVDGVHVCLLYPKGKVSPLQEKQMTTLGENITAIEVDGVFDDCQRLVKQAFTDRELNEVKKLSSANSINIARLLPQSFYYAFAVGELQKRGVNNSLFSVPSGNFGNLTGGLLAMKMGMPAEHFIAATNVNDVVPRFLQGSAFIPKDSIQTISNAMDVGDPSNFVRMRHLFDNSDTQLRNHLTGYSYTDGETRQTIREVFEDFGYLLCPHTAIGYRAARDYQAENNAGSPVVTLATAHPVKFRDVIEQEINQKAEIPERLKSALKREKKAISLGKEFEEFKNLLLDSLSGIK